MCQATSTSLLHGAKVYDEHLHEDVTYKTPLHIYVSTGFNFGNIAYAIAAAAKHAARRGEHQLAKDMLQAVLEGMYDNILSKDPQISKVDNKGRLVRVHPEAPKENFERFLEVGSAEEKYCLDVPEQYNHGMAAAQAAMQIHMAIGEINWQGTWNVISPKGDKISKSSYTRLLWNYVRRNALWMKSAFMFAPGGTGASEKDRYPGPSGTDSYIWKYRDVRECKIYRGTFKDRPQDISHGSIEMDFVNEFLQWSRTKPSGGRPKNLQGIFCEDDVHRLIVTFLNRNVRSYDGNVTDRFACDILGTVDEDQDEFAWKSCGGGDGSNKEKRPRYAAAWATLTHAAQYFIANNGGSKALKCDVYRMVKTIFQVALDGMDDFYKEEFKGLSQTWTSELIVAKYFFYNYDHGMEEACGSSELPKSDATTPAARSDSPSYAQDKFTEWLSLSYPYDYYDI